MNANHCADDDDRWTPRRMLDVSETLSDACAACHEKYRDVDLSGGTRCKVGK